MEHKDLPIEGSHFAHAWVYANEAARTGASGFVAADVGKLAVQTDDWTIWILTSTTPTWEPACKKAFFGTSQFDDFDATEVTTTSSSPVVAKQYTLTIPAHGVYRVGWSSGFRGSSTTSDMRIHLYVDGSQVQQFNMENKDSNSWHPFCNFKAVELTTGFHQFSIRISSEGGITSRIRDIAFEFWGLRPL